MRDIHKCGYDESNVDDAPTILHGILSECLGDCKLPLKDKRNIMIEEIIKFLIDDCEEWHGSRGGLSIELSCIANKFIYRMQKLDVWRNR